MRILFFAWSEDAEVVVSRWFPSLSQNPHQFAVTPFFSFAQKNKSLAILARLKNAERSRSVQVFPIFLRSSNMSLKNLLNPAVIVNDFTSIAKILLTFRPEIVVALYANHAYPLTFFRRLLKFKLVPYVMGDEANFNTSVFERFMKKVVYAESDLVLSVADDLKPKIEKEFPCTVKVIPHGINVKFFRLLTSKTDLKTKWGIGISEVTILTVCRLDKNKGVDLLIKAIKSLNSESTAQRRFRLLVCGDGPERESLIRLSNNLGVKDYVRFLGFTKMNDLLELYNIADIFALASYSEGLPKVMLEAMACGCIPIMTNVGDIKTVIANDHNGFIVKPGCSADFVKAIQSISAFSPEKIQRMQKAAVESVQAAFDNEKLVNSMITEIEQLTI